MRPNATTRERLMGSETSVEATNSSKDENSLSSHTLSPSLPIASRASEVSLTKTKRRTVRSVRNATDTSLLTDHDRAKPIGNELPRFHLGALDVTKRSGLSFKPSQSLRTSPTQRTHAAGADRGLHKVASSHASDAESVPNRRRSWLLDTVHL